MQFHCTSSVSNILLSLSLSFSGQKLMEHVVTLKYRMNTTTSLQHSTFTANIMLRLVESIRLAMISFCEAMNNHPLPQHDISLRTRYLRIEIVTFCQRFNTVFTLVLQKALRKAHVYPRSGRKYSVGYIVAVIEYAFGAMPSLVCKNGSVQELRLCFHKDYQVIYVIHVC